MSAKRSAFARRRANRGKRNCAMNTKIHVRFIRLFCRLAGSFGAYLSREYASFANIRSGGIETGRKESVEIAFQCVGLAALVDRRRCQ